MVKKRIAIICLAGFISGFGYLRSTEAQRSSSSGPAKKVDDAALRRADSNRTDWISHGRNYGETRFSPLSQINAANVKQLGLAWSFETETNRGLEATPLVVDGVMYTTGSWSIVFALDARSGKLLWKYDPKVDRSFGSKACCDVVNRGVALYKGKVYVGALDGRLIALDAATGNVIWEIVTVDQSRPYTITGAPRVVKGKVLIGNGGAEYGVRGYVSAYDAETGKLAWRTYTVPGDPSKPFESPAMQKAASTWNGNWWEIGGGGTAWDSLAYDPELDLVYVGTGNGTPWNPHLRGSGGGDNLYLSSILALKADTGEMVWYYQTTPGDAWDYTATQHMILADLTIGGRQRKVLMQAPKNGFFYVLDRKTGELISAEPYMKLTWATGIDKKTGRPIENPGVRYEKSGILQSPGPLGGHNWQPMSYSSRTGLVYIPAQDNASYYAQPQNFQYRPGVWNTGIALGTPPGVQRPPSKGHLLAWDPVAQKERWRVQYTMMWNSGLLSTAGNLVFQGTGDGRFVAYSADKGENLWEVKAASGVIGSPMTYEIDGIQYVAVMVGWGGAGGLGAGRAGATGPPPPGRLLTFALSGKRPLPEIAAQSIRDLAPIENTAPRNMVEKGALLYEQYCSVCHGQDAVGGGGGVPDLRLSARSMFDTYEKVLIDGALSSSGMPSFKQWLKPEDVQAIRGFVVSRRAEITNKK